jgi:hypothetical protein
MQQSAVEQRYRLRVTDDEEINTKIKSETKKDARYPEIQEDEDGFKDSTV